MRLRIGRVLPRSKQTLVPRTGGETSHRILTPKDHFLLHFPGPSQRFPVRSLDPPVPSFTPALVSECYPKR